MLAVNAFRRAYSGSKAPAELAGSGLIHFDCQWLRLPLIRFDLCWQERGVSSTSLSLHLICMNTHLSDLHKASTLSNNLKKRKKKTLFLLTHSLGGYFSRPPQQLALLN